MLSIPEFYNGKNIFITGGSGFIGKCLIEKLLRSCPDIGNIYILIRAKRGKNPQARIKEITDNVLFDSIKENNPSSLNKIIAVPGNTEILRLGLAAEDEELLASQVHIIYHCAAQVNFNISLKNVIIQNVRSARELSNLALKFKILKVLVHVSTMYSHCDEDIIDEKVYPAKVDWRDVISVAEDSNLTRSLEVMSLKYIEPFPNTYTFSKKISEQVFYDLCKDKVPLVICRPSIVVYAMKEPVVGWTDNLNGPFSLLIGPMKGISDIGYGKPETCLDKVFVDNVAKSLIMATWKKNIDSENNMKVSVYNACSDLSWKMKYYEDFKGVMWQLPMENRFGYGGTSRLTSCWYYYYFSMIIFNVIPALFGDLFLKLSGKKTLLFNYQKKIFLANTFLLYFMSRTFIFKNEGYKTLENKIMAIDRAAFAFREHIPTDYWKIGEQGLLGLKRYVFHEKYPVAPETFANTKKFYILHLVFVWLRYFILGYILIWKWNLHLVLWHKFSNYVNNL